MSLSRTRELFEADGNESSSCGSNEVDAEERTLPSKGAAVLGMLAGIISSVCSSEAGSIEFKIRDIRDSLFAMILCRRAEAASALDIESIMKRCNTSSFRD